MMLLLCLILLCPITSAIFSGEVGELINNCHLITTVGDVNVLSRQNNVGSYHLHVRGIDDNQSCDLFCLECYCGELLKKNMCVRYMLLYGVTCGYQFNIFIGQLIIYR